ncbi:hypothetical protein [Winogradskyella sp. 3972H.M.0a.05]
MKKLKTSGCLFSKSDKINGNRNIIDSAILTKVTIMKALKISVFPELYR